MYDAVCMENLELTTPQSVILASIAFEKTVRKNNSKLLMSCLAGCSAKTNLWGSIHWSGTSER